MGQTTIVGFGLVGLLVLILITVVLAGGWIQDDIRDRVLADLDAAGIADAKIEVSGRDIVLTSTNPDNGAKARAVAGAVWGVRAVE